MIKKIVIPVAVAVVIFAIAVSFDFDEPVTLDELPQNAYTGTPVTTPIKVTTQTIEPSSVQVDTETQSVTPTVSEKNNYPGAGFVFPFLQKSFGISASTTTLNVEDWNLGINFLGLNQGEIWKDETASAFAGNIYFGALDSSIHAIYSLNPTTDVLTTWTTPTDGWEGNLSGNSVGHVFYTKGVFGTIPNDETIQRLDPSTDQITVWQMWSAVGDANPHGLVVDQTSGIVYAVPGNAPSRFYSLNPATNEVKVWNVNSICPTTSFGFHGLAIDSDGLLYANLLDTIEVCTLDPATNQVTLYDTGLDFGRTWQNDIDSTNPGHLYLVSNGLNPNNKIILVDTVSNESTVWSLSNLGNAVTLDVDSNGLVWIPTLSDSANVDSNGLVMLNPDTNSITEWEFGYAARANIFAATNGDIWVRVSNIQSGVLDHILRFF